MFHGIKNAIIGFPAPSKGAERSPDLSFQVGFLSQKQKSFHALEHFAEDFPGVGGE